MKSKLKLVVFVLVYVVSGLALVFYLADTPLSISTSNGDHAAIAIRDNVSHLEKNGSLLFTKTYLNKKYKYNIYFTQEFNGDKRKEFTDSLALLLKNYKSVDVYLLAHHNNYYNWFRDIDPELLSRLNMVYNTGCGNAADSSRYKDSGAKYYIAHKGKQSLSPIFYFYFLRRMDPSKDPEIATAAANERVVRILNFLGIRSEIKEHEGSIY